jgi:hypothetical protein
VTIPYFAGNQNVVFVPALCAVLAATVLVCLPIVFAQRLRRSPFRISVLAAGSALAAVALIGAAWLAGAAFRTLGEERARVQAELQQTYSVRLDRGEVGELVDGGKPERTLPAVARAAGLPNPDKPHTLKLVPTSEGADTYVLTLGGKTWPKS